MTPSRTSQETLHGIGVSHLPAASAAGLSIPLRVLDLFSGIGGFSLGLERTGGFQTVAFCEIEEFPRRVLKKHWPKVPCYHDIRELTADTLARDGIAVDVICGGFPCQPFSPASRGRRVAVDLWPEMLRLVEAVRPPFVIAENVQEFPIRRATEAFKLLGYRAFYRRIGAHDGGADHTRDRWWSIAYADDQGELPSAVDAEVARLPEICGGLWGARNYARAIRVPDGVPHRMDRFKCLGNTVMPFIPQGIGNAVLQHLEASR